MIRYKVTWRWAEVCYYGGGEVRMVMMMNEDVDGGRGAGVEGGRFFLVPSLCPRLQGPQDPANARPILRIII